MDRFGKIWKIWINREDMKTDFSEIKSVLEGGQFERFTKYQDIWSRIAYQLSPIDESVSKFKKSSHFYVEISISMLKNLCNAVNVEAEFKYFSIRIFSRDILRTLLFPRISTCPLSQNALSWPKAVYLLAVSYRKSMIY